MINDRRTAALRHHDSKLTPSPGLASWAKLTPRLPALGHAWFAHPCQTNKDFGLPREVRGSR